MTSQFRTFYVTKSSKEYRVGLGPNDAARLFTISTSSSSPQMIMARRPPQIAAHQQLHQPEKSSISALFNLSSLPTRGTDPVVATATFASKIDIQVENSFGQSIKVVMKKSNLLSSSRTFCVPGLGELHWKMDSGGFFFGSTRRLVDQGGLEVARYEKGERTSFFGGRVENTICVVDDQRFLDSFLEVVVITCLAAVEYDRRREEEDWAEVVEAVAGV